MTDLKPCPFCGGRAIVTETDELGAINYSVSCTKCPTNFGRYWYWKKIDAVLAWNRRAANDH